MSKIVQIIFKNIHLNENKVAPFLKLTMNEHDRYGKLKYFKILDSIEKIT